MRNISTLCGRSLPAILSLFMFTNSLFAQPVSITGDTAQITSVIGASTIVDNNITVISAVSITNVSVLIATNYMPGDILTVDNTALPAGASSGFNAATGRLTITGTASASQWQTALRKVSFKTTSFTSGPRKIVFTLGKAMYNFSTGHFYEKVGSGMSWVNAKAAAEAKSFFGLGGYLATITSMQENNFIWVVLQGGDGWIGSTDDYTLINAAIGAPVFVSQEAAEGKWYWVCGPEKGTQFTDVGDTAFSSTLFTNWYSGEPSNWGDDQNYGQIYYNSNGFWNDLPASVLMGYVIEYGGLSTDPATNIIHGRDVVVAVASLTGDGATPGDFINDTTSYLVDRSVIFQNITAITNVSVRISQNFQDSDALEYDNAFLPAGVTANYDSAAGILNFNGTALADDWNILLQTITFKTSSADLSDRKITFAPGNPALHISFIKTMSYLVVLPATLLSFNVHKENKTAVIEWKTANEKRNSYYIIERSADTRSFSSVGRLDGRGPTVGWQQYRFIDRQPLPGFSYYRLRQVDEDSNSSFSAVRHIDFNTNVVNRIYPTITGVSIHVELGYVTASTYCYLINASGSLIRKIKPSGLTFTLPVQFLSDGVYILRIINGDGQQDNLRFIKQ